MNERLREADERALRGAVVEARTTRLPQVRAARRRTFRGGDSSGR
jgi:hypothetical protein